MPEGQLIDPDASDEEVLAWLRDEYNQKFEGWDFSYLHGREEKISTLPWDYGATLARVVPKCETVLEMDTGMEINDLRQSGHHADIAQFSCSSRLC